MDCPSVVESSVLTDAVSPSRATRKNGGSTVGSELPVQKVYGTRFSPVQKISTWYKSTFRPFRDPRHDGFSKTRKDKFLFCVSRRTWDQKNAIFTGKTQILNYKRDGRGWEEVRYDCGGMGVEAARRV